jgi:uncharacterized integral membrane protein (TIGR00698 family)
MNPHAAALPRAAANAGFAKPRQELARVLPGIALATLIAVESTLLSACFHLSAMVFALAIGMAFNWLAAERKFKPGIEVTSRAVLRTGVALLGLRITLGEAAGLGWAAIGMAAAGIVLTIGLGLVLARVLRLGDRLGVLSAGAVSICGASATLAINSVLPKDADSERDATFVVVAVTGLSTIAMFLYPLVAGLAGLDDRAAGMFFGGTIHDVAQVVGAGYSISEKAGDTATLMKLLRVAMLFPVCVAIGMVIHARGRKATGAAPVLPWFAVAFAVLMAVGSTGWVPVSVVDAGGSLSRGLLAVAMAGIGMKTSLRGLVSVGPRAMLLVVIETAFIALLVLGILCAFGR